MRSPEHTLSEVAVRWGWHAADRTGAVTSGPLVALKIGLFERSMDGGGSPLLMICCEFGAEKIGQE